MEVMAQRTGEKKVVAAKIFPFFSGKLHLFCIKTKVSFWPFLIMQSLHSFCAKMAKFLAASSFFSPVLWAMNSLETKTVYIVGFLKCYNFPIEFMAQRTYEKKFVAAKNIAIFFTKTEQSLYNKMGTK